MNRQIKKEVKASGNIICLSTTLTAKYSHRNVSSGVPVDNVYKNKTKTEPTKSLTEECAVCLRKRTILVSEAGQTRAM